MNLLSHLEHWFNLTDVQIRTLFTKAGENIGLPPFAIEKDWWVVTTLSLISSMDCGEYLVFKGGTSLSKGWNLIERFSEDIDLALDREFLGFEKELKKAGIRRLRRKSDYNKMRENMIYGESLEFDDLIQRLTTLEKQINALDWRINLED